MSESRDEYRTHLNDDFKLCMLQGGFNPLNWCDVRMGRDVGF